MTAPRSRPGFIGMREASARTVSSRRATIATTVTDRQRGRFMPLEIAQLGQPVLRQVAAEVAHEKIGRPQLQEFLNEMMETVLEAKGAGLAAPQVFVSLRIFLAAILPA